MVVRLSLSFPLRERAGTLLRRVGLSHGVTEVTVVNPVPLQWRREASAKKKLERMQEQRWTNHISSLSSGNRRPIGARDDTAVRPQQAKDFSRRRFFAALEWKTLSGCVVHDCELAATSCFLTLADLSFAPCLKSQPIRAAAHQVRVPTKKEVKSSLLLLLSGNLKKTNTDGNQLCFCTEVVLH